MHAEAMAYVERMVRTYGPFDQVVDLGGQDLNGTPRRIFRHAMRYVSVDQVAGRGVDVVADAADYRPPFTPDCVVCTEVLEHTAKGEAILRNARAMLAPGGILILTAATDPRGPHSAVAVGMPPQRGEYYRNVSEAALRQWLLPYAWWAIETYRDRGDIYAVARRGVC